MSARFLLDVSVLLALVDDEHEFFQVAHAWVRSLDRVSWASCPITQNGFVRIYSQPKYVHAVPVSEACRRLERMIALTDHQFWPDDISILDPAGVRRDRLVGHRQITDAYLLALAVKHGGRLVTFDRAVPIDAVVGAGPEHVVMLGR
jgi:toxin-antitoxin system PIN domain toxin